jgi:hypothetical protein
LRPGDQGGLVGDYSCAGQGGACLDDVIGVGVEEVDATETVHLQVDKARDSQTGPGGGEADCLDHPI